MPHTKKDTQGAHDKKSSAHTHKSKPKKDPTTYQGIILLNRRGNGFLLHAGEKITVSAKDLATAQHGDTVKFTMYTTKWGKGADVREIISRRKTAFTGVIRKTATGYVVNADDTKFNTPILVHDGFPAEIKEGDKVYIDITDWTAGKLGGSIREILGTHGEHKTEMASILRDRSLVEGFPDHIEKAAESLYDNYDPDAEAKTRRDFRGIATFTIDPVDAKDFDDALSYETLPDGSYEVGVHIADVSHFVRPNDTLDQLAQERGTSIYLVDRVIPMLPETLSNDLASLKEKVDRLTMSAVFTFNKEGQIIKEWFGKTIIYSQKRFSYESAEAILDGGDGPFKTELNALNEIAKARIKGRAVRGALELDSDEVKADLNTDGLIVGFHHKTRGQSHRLVEELMLLANEYVATFIEKKTKVIGFYRIHDNPEIGRIEDLRGFLAKLDYKLEGKGGDQLRKSFRKILKLAADDKAHDAIQVSIIRSMAKAIYSTTNKGHFGLALGTYTHFTSPIRRYPDVIVHRILQALLTGVNEPYNVQTLNSFADTTSAQERNAQDAERSSIKLKQMEYLLARKENIFTGRITNINGWGAFVEEQTSACEGFIKVELFPKECVFDEKKLHIENKTTNQIWRIGDELPIKVANVDMDRKEVDFKLA